MSIPIKTEEEIIKMRIVGILASDVLDMIEPYVVPGVTTEELDNICHDYIVNTQKSIPAPLNYHNFPKSICTSVNHQICHGIPSNKKLKKGDIINIDITVIKDEYHGDTSRMFAVGEATIKGKRIMQVSYDCLQIGMAQVKPGLELAEIGRAIEKYANKQNCSVVREYCGHGIGKKFHDEPQVLHYADKDSGIILEPGMTFTIEPMINLGKRHIKVLPDKWTVVTKDRSLSAQWEHTILVTESGFDILTQKEQC